MARKKRKKPLGDPPGKTCAGGELVVGYPNPHVSKARDSGFTAICLTPNQHKKLFGKSGLVRKPLGCGTFACAYPRSARTVVKITTDPTDVAAMIQARRKRSSAVVQLKAVYELIDAGHDIYSPKAKGGNYGKPRKAYAMIVERLRPLSHEAEQLFFTAVDTIALESIAALHDDLPTMFRLPNEYWGGQAHACEDKYGSGTTAGKACIRLGTGVAKAFEKVIRAGIDWTDIHPRNIGVTLDGEDIKVLDLGMTSTAPDPRDVPQLRSPFRPRRRGMPVRMKQIRLFR